MEDEPVRTPVIPRIPQYDAREMISEGSTAHILLDGQTYILRITRVGKLILTK